MSNSAGPKITKDGLVLDFDAANPKSYKPSSDPYFSAVSLLLSMNGANGSTTFTDSSPNALAVTAVGNAQISTAQSKYGGSAGYFDGTGDYLSIAANAAIDLSSDDFTIEFWVRPAPKTNAVDAVFGYGNYGCMFYHNGTNWTLEMSSTGSSNQLVISCAVTLNTWQHIAIVRNGSNVVVYKDGVSSATGTFTGALATSSRTLRIGDNGNSQNINGYIDDFRISRFARYLSNFTPPNTSLPAIASTVPYDPYYIKTSLLLHMDGANGSTTFTDSGPNALTVTANGNAQISTAQSKFGGASAYFDGTGDYISSSSTNITNFGTGDFTVEFWFYSTISGGISIFDTRTNETSPNGNGFVIGTNSSSQWVVYQNGNQIIGSTLVTNTWTHVAATRSGTSFKLFINGTQTGSTWTTSNNFSDGAFLVGTDYPLNARFVNGYIDDLRVTKGIARYKSSFTPSTTALVEYAPEDDRYFNNVSLLLHMDGANASTIFVDSGPNALAVTAAAGAQIQTNVKKYGSASCFFDGLGDSLTIPANTALALGTGDYTIEGWFYSYIYTYSLRGMIDFRTATTGTNGLMLRENDGGFLVFLNSATLLQTSTGRIPNQWQHIAIVRKGTTVTLYVDGVSKASTTSSADLTDSILRISGFVDTQSSDYTYNGNIDELRITKGIARYNSNFTIPSSAYPNNTYAPVTATAIDLTKNKITGTFVNGVDYSAANGGSLVFDGVDDYVNISANSNLNFGTGDFTIDCWYNLSATTPNDQGILNDTAGTFSSGSVLFKARQNSSGGKVSLQAYDFSSIGNRILTSTTTIAANTWYNATVTRIGNSFTLYINGRSESTGTFSGTMNFNNNNGTYIGYSILDGVNGYLNGRIPNIKIYKGKGLTSTEVYNNFVANRGRFGV